GAAQPDQAAVQRVVGSEAITLLAAKLDGRIVGFLALAMFPIPTGHRAWIEDVIVDETARGRGIGEALTRKALDLAETAGARTVDLTSRPSRDAAAPLYERVRAAPPTPRTSPSTSGRPPRPAARPASPAARPPRRHGDHGRSGRCSGPARPAPRCLRHGCRARRSAPSRSCARSPRSPCGRPDARPPPR